MVKGLQEKLGFQILLLSVDGDNSYGDAKAQDAETMRSHGISWPNVLIPGGWDGAIGTLNLDGYGLALIDAKGVVLGANLFPEQLETLLRSR